MPQPVLDNRGNRNADKVSFESIDKEIINEPSRRGELRRVLGAAGAGRDSVAR